MSKNLAVSAAIRAKDEASPTIRKIGGAMTGLADRAQGLAGRAQSAAAGLGAIGGGMAGLAGAATVGAIGVMVTDVAALADETAKAADRIGVGVEAMQELRFAASRGGMDVAEFTDALKEMSIKTGQALQGDERLIGLFDAMGVSLDDLKNKSPDQVLEMLSDSFAKIEDPALKAMAANELFGGSGHKMINVISAGSEALRQSRKDARAYGVITEEQARASEKFNDTLGDMQAAFTGVSNALLLELVPPLERGAREVAEFVKENQGLVKAAGLAVVGVGALAGGLAAASAGYSMVIAPALKVSSVLAGPAVGGTKAFILALRSGLPVLSALRIAIMSNPLGLIVTAAVAAGAAAYMLWDNWDDVVSGLSDGWAWLEGRLSDVWNSIQDLFQSGGEFVQGKINALGDWLGNFDLLGGLFTAVTDKVDAVTGAFDEGLLQGILALMSAFNPATLMIEALDGLAAALFGYDLSEAGANIVNSILDGIGDLAGRLEDAIAEPLAAMREYLPFSPAKRGPLTDLDAAGQNIVGNIVGGMEKAGAAPGAALGAAMAPLPDQIAAVSAVGAARRPSVPVAPGGGMLMPPALSGVASGARASAPIEITVTFANSPPGLKAEVTSSGGGTAQISLNMGASGAGARGV